MLVLPAARVTAEPGRYVGYLEAHIEQGDTLESGGLAIGIVTFIVGIWQYRISFKLSTLSVCYFTFRLCCSVYSADLFGARVQTARSARLNRAHPHSLSCLARTASMSGPCLRCGSERHDHFQ
jgi:hypothetical protein